MNCITVAVAFKASGIFNHNLSQDFAVYVHNCSDMCSETNLPDIYDIRKSCEWVRKGWLNQDASIDQSLWTRYDEMGISDNITDCLNPAKVRFMKHFISNIKYSDA